MPSQTALIEALILFSIVIIGVLVARPELTASRGGKILAFAVLFFLPAICGAIGMSSEMERSKTTAFCLSCHNMEAYGRSLLVDDPGHLVAAHFQNHRVPPDEACYTCHTNYAMFGTFKAKLGGLRHVYVYYLGEIPPLGQTKLHEPYNNRECLHCHLGARSFEEGAVHNADPVTLPAVKANKLSCVSSGCHETVHDVTHLDNVKFWNGAK
jgi:cytochrome c-type protein NapC